MASHVGKGTSGVAIVRPENDAPEHGEEKQRGSWLDLYVSPSNFLAQRMTQAPMVPLSLAACLFLAAHLIWASQVDPEAFVQQIFPGYRNLPPAQQVRAVERLGSTVFIGATLDAVTRGLVLPVLLGLGWLLSLRFRSYVESARPVFTLTAYAFLAPWLVKNVVALVMAALGDQWNAPLSQIFRTDLGWFASLAGDGGGRWWLVWLDGLDVAVFWHLLLMWYGVRILLPMQSKRHLAWHVLATWFVFWVVSAGALSVSRMAGVGNG